MARVIVIGGGLAGMSAAHTIIQAGGRVTLLDKSAFNGGNSTKATSGINGAGSRAQRALGIPDTAEQFEKDTTVSAAEGARPDLIRVLTHESGPAIDWLENAFGLDLSVIARLAAHTEPRTHRGTETFPGMMITYGLMEKLDEIAEATPEIAQVINKAEVTELIQENGVVKGCVFVKGGKEFKMYGPVIIATGGFGADFTDKSLLSQVKDEFALLEAWSTTSRAAQQSGGKKIPCPPLLTLPTTNGKHCTGDGIKLALQAGAGTYDLHCVQIHPTGLLDPNEPDSKVKFLAAEALRGSGGLILDNQGERFCDELGKRDYVSGREWIHGKGPYRLILNEAAQELISWHIEHYEGRGLMKKMTGAELAKEIGVPTSKLQNTFDEYNEGAKTGKDKWGKKFFTATPVNATETFAVAVIEPVIHYCMGGVAGDKEARVITQDGVPVPGLFVGGEALGGVHGVNRLGGSSLLDCVVYGRVAGRSATKFMLEELLQNGGAGAGGASSSFNVNVNPGSKSLTISWDGATAAAAGGNDLAGLANEKSDMSEDPNQAFYAKGVDSSDAPAAGGDSAGVYTMEEVAKHTTEDDIWVVVHGKVLNIGDFLEDHPGGKKAIMLYAGKDATPEFDMLHKAGILEKYASEYIIGTVQGQSKL